MSRLSPRHEDIFSEIILCYNNLTRAETKVADYVLRHKQTIHRQSISELAANCEVSEATITRFCHSIGCGSYNEFKLTVVQSSVSSDNMRMGTDLYSTLLPSESLSTAPVTVKG